MTITGSIKKDTSNTPISFHNGLLPLNEFFNFFVILLFLFLTRLKQKGGSLAKLDLLSPHLYLVSLSYEKP